MKKHKLVRKVVIGSAIVGAAGYVASVVNANKLNKSKNDQFESIEERLKFLHTEISDLITNTNLEKKGTELDKKAKKQLDLALSIANASKDKISQVLDAVKDNKVKDSDLKAALTEAEKAIVHAKKFLLK